MPDLVLLTAAHRDAVLAFERANRQWFARSVTDRGDAYFEHFDERMGRLLAEQDKGVSFFHLLVEDDEILGRFNLMDLAGGSATIGYRVAESATGRGVATEGVRRLCDVARTLGAHTLRAATSDENVASQRVLAKTGFTDDGPAAPEEIGGKRGRWWRLEL